MVVYGWFGVCRCQHLRYTVRMYGWFGTCLILLYFGDVSFRA